MNHDLKNAIVSHRDDMKLVEFRLKQINQFIIEEKFFSAGYQLGLIHAYVKEKVCELIELGPSEDEVDDE